MPPNFELISVCVHPIIGCLLMWIHAKHPRANNATAVIIPMIYSWLYIKIHPRLIWKMEQMYQHALVRRNRPNLKALCLEIVQTQCNIRRLDRCSLCGACAVRQVYFGCQQYENGRRYRIFMGVSLFALPMPGYFEIMISCISICRECNRHDCVDIFLDMLKTMIDKRKRLVKKANLVRSLMMQRYFRRRVGNDLTGKLMSFVCWTPEIVIY